MNWERKKFIFGAGLIALLILLSYWPALQAGFVWDDDSYVTTNQTLRTVQGLKEIWTQPRSTPQYYPLTFTTFWVQYHLWKLNPLGYHFVNIVFHIFNAILIWVLLKKLKIISAFLVSLLFALHPVCVESVAWITELKNVQAFFFYLLAMTFYFRFNPIENDVKDAKQWRYYGFSMFFYLCALLSKSVTCSLPVAILIIEWWKCKENNRRTWLLLLPFFAFGVGMGLMTAGLERNHVGADWDFNFIERCLIAGHAILFYAVKVLLPFNLTFIYPRWEISVAKISSFIYPAIVVFLFTLFWMKRKVWGRGVFAAALFFIVTLFPALGFIDIYPMKFSFVADHFQYMAIVGMLILFAEGARKRYVRYFLFSPINRNRVVACILFVFIVTTFQQTQIYKDEEALYLNTIYRNPSCKMCYLNLDTVYKKQNRIDELRERYLFAIENIPNFYEAYYNLGAVYLMQNNPKRAASYYQQILMAGVEYPLIYFNLAMAYEQREEFHEAVQLFKKHIQLNPQDVRGYQKLGSCFARMNLFNQAVSYYQKAKMLSPQDGQIWYNLGVLYLKKEMYPEAVEHNRQAIYFNPGFTEAYYNLGFAYEKIGQKQRALELYRKALELDPESKKALQQIQRIKQDIEPEEL